MSDATQVMPLGLDPNGLVYFSLALIAGAGIVVFSSWRKFDESTLEKSDGDFITQLLPRDLASPREYAQGMLTYMGAMLAVLLVFSLLGPPLLKLFNIQSSYAGLTPVIVALALFQVIWKIPGLQEIESSIRQFAHFRAFIPAAARATAGRLTAADFDFANYRGIDGDEMSGVQAGDFDAARGSIEYNWARLCSLSYALRVRQEQQSQELDGRLLQSYRTDLESIYTRRSALEEQIAQFRANTKNAALRQQLRADIRDALQKLYIFIGCAVRLRAKPAGVDPVLRTFGFVLPPVPVQSEGDAMVVGITVAGLSVFLVCYLGVELGQAHLWTPSEYFPRHPIEPFVWALSAVFAHGSTILVANMLRRRWTDDWYIETSDGRQRSTANYIRIGVLCAATAFAVLILFAAAFQAQLPSLAMAQGSAPYALMPAATGVFFVYHFDSVELGLRPRSRLLEILPQAAVTGFFGFAASQVWINLGNSDGWSGFDFLILVGAMGTVVGAALAWFIPRYAVSSACDPIARERDARITQVKTLAAQILHGPQAAQQWLEETNASLQGASPLSALADEKNYEEVIRLLNSAAAIK